MNSAVVADVAVSHDEAIVANRGVLSFAGCPVKGHVFSKNVVVADLKECGLVGVFSVLGIAADDAALSEIVVFAQGRRVFDGYVRLKNASWSDYRSSLDV